MPLGDVWSGEAPPPENSPLAMEYYRQKAEQFQATLNAVDAAYQAANTALQSGAIDNETQAALIELLDQYDNKRLTLKLTAEAINAGAAVINGLGGRFPQLSIPQTLGLAPVAPFALVAAIATAATLIVWGSQWIAGVNERLKRAQLIENASPDQKERLIGAIAASDNAVTQASAGTLAEIAPAVKWAAIAVVAWLAWRTYSGRK